MEKKDIARVKPVFPKLWKAICRQVKINKPEGILNLYQGGDENTILHDEEPKFCSAMSEMFPPPEGSELDRRLGFHPQEILSFIVTGTGLDKESQRKIYQHFEVPLPEALQEITS